METDAIGFRFFSQLLLIFIKGQGLALERAVLFAKNLPSGLTIVLELALRICRPPSIHLISAMGFEGAVEQVKTTTSPTLASVGPEMVTCVGATIHPWNGKRR